MATVLLSCSRGEAGIFLDGSGNWTVSGGGNGGISVGASDQTATILPGATMGTLNLSANPALFSVSVGGAGAISGLDGIVLGTDGTITLNNSGTISGNGGFGVVGSGANLTLTMNASGALIVGTSSGIDTFSGGILRINDNQGIIRGLTSDGVTALDDSVVVNSSTIEGLGSSTSDGIDVFNRATITNNAAGIISGADDGIDAADDTLITNSGQIIGNGAGSRGISVWANSTITNNASGLILGTGTDGIGVQMLDAGILKNHGMIRADDGTGLLLGLHADITNSGTITGLLSGDGIRTDGGFFTLNNQSGGLVQGALNGVTISGELTPGITHITNAGTIQGDGGHGVNADGIADLGILNQTSGIIRATGGAGVLSGDNLTLDNQGQIHGDTDGVVTTGGELLISNSGTIDGGNGIQISSFLSAPVGGIHITNTGGSALIHGTAGDGVFAPDSLVLQNLSGATIRSTGGNGINAGYDLTVTNNASQIHGDAGAGAGLLSAGGLLQVSNLSGGVIDGQRGIVLTDTLIASALAHNIRNESGSTIKGLSGHGIEALDDLAVGNVAGSTIQGIGGDGINAGANTMILNTSGSHILGDAASGVGVTSTGGAVNIQNLAGADIQGAKGIVLTGDVAALAPGDVTIVNDASLIEGKAGHGVEAQNALVLSNLNAATIKSTDGSGILAGMDLVILNDTGSQILGDSGSGQGISGGGGAFTVQNLTGSTIRGMGGIEITGDVTGSGPHVFNDGASTIEGLAGNGITGQGSLFIMNTGSSTIKSTGGNGIDAGVDFIMLNTSASQVHGDAAAGWGITDAGGVTQIQNDNGSVIDGMGGIRITGDVSAPAGNAPNILNTGAGTLIEGLAGDGVNAMGGLLLHNLSGATIKSTDGNGVTAGSGLILKNLEGAQILSVGGNGVSTGLDATILNGDAPSLIQGDLTTGIGVTSTGGAFVLQNLSGATTEGQRGVVLTGDVAPLTAGEVHIRNNASFITGHDGHGIEALNGLTVINQNAGIISGETTITLEADGIHSGDGLAVLNTDAGTVIKGSKDGVYAANGVGVNNRSGAKISGLGGDGIQAGDDLNVFNNSVIQGVLKHGVFSKNDLRMTNAITGKITGGVDGVQTEDHAEITQRGRVAGLSGDGIQAGNALNLGNMGLARILGATNGVVALNGARVHNFGLIKGSTLHGIRAEDELTFLNRLRGTTRGAIHAVQAQDRAVVVNRGWLAAGTGAGVQAVNSLVFRNDPTGLVTGTRGIETLGENAMGGASITNYGRIFVKDRAIVTGPGMDFVDQYGTLSSGSGIDMHLGAGNDLVILHNGVVSTGQIIGGTHTIGDHLILDGAVHIRAHVLEVERTDTNGPGVSIIDRGVILESDLVSINSGQLHLNGRIRGSDHPYASVIVQNTATLSGNGVVQGFLRVARGGTITPGNLGVGSIGKLTITRQLRLDSGSTYVADFNGNSKTSDLLRAGRTALVRGNIVIRQQGFFERGDRFTVVSAPRVKGRFQQVYGAEITPTLGFVQQVSPQAIDFAVLANMAGIDGLTPHEHTIAKYLDRITTEGTDRLRAILTNLDYSDAGTIQRTLSQIDPVIYGAVATSKLQHAHLFAQSEGNRLESLRRPLPQGDSGSGNDGTEVSKPSRSENPVPTSLWLEASGASYDQDSYVETNGFTASMAALTLGADVEVTDQCTAGLYLSIQDDHFNAGPWGSDGESQGAVIGLHATHGYRTGLYVDGGASVGYASNRVEHDYPAVGLADDAESDYGSVLWRGSLSLGYRWEVGNWNFGPLARFDYAGVHENAVEEHGSHGLDLKLDDRYRDSARLEVGFKVMNRNGHLGKFRFTPAASLMFTHEFIEQDNPITASLVDADVGYFRVNGLRTPNNSLTGSLGFGIELTEQTTLSFGYTLEHELGSHAAVRHSGGVGLGVRF